MRYNPLIELAYNQLDSERPYYLVDWNDVPMLVCYEKDGTKLFNELTISEYEDLLRTYLDKNIGLSGYVPFQKQLSVVGVNQAIPIEATLVTSFLAKALTTHKGKSYDELTKLIIELGSEF